MSEIFSYVLYYGTYILYVFLLFLILKSIFRTTLNNHHSKWNTLIDGFSFSTQEFYKLLKEEILSNGINRVGVDQVSLTEGSLFSSRRTYLRITWKDYQYDVCAAPFGKGFFVSWWLIYKNSIGEILISKIPFVGNWLVTKLYPVTYYKIDTASMFMSYAQASVLKVIDEITTNKGTRSLSESERKPILNDIFRR